MKPLKYEQVCLSEYENLADARAQIGHFLEAVYNQKRPHSSLGYLPPAEFEQAHQTNRDKNQTHHTLTIVSFKGFTSLLVQKKETAEMLSSRFTHIWWQVPLLSCLALLLSGCGKTGSQSVIPGLSEHYDVLVMVDHSGSTRTNPPFNNTLHQVGEVYLSMIQTGPHNEVCLQHGGVDNDTLYDGKGKGLSELRDKLDGLASGKADDDGSKPKAAVPQGNHVPYVVDGHDEADGLGNGSRIVETELAPALAWINDRPKDDQKMVIIISDLVADPTKYKDGTVQHYLDPAKFKWTVQNPKNIHLRCYMVGTDTTNTLQSTWQNSGIDMRFFHPGYTVDKSDFQARDAQ